MGRLPGSKNKPKKVVAARPTSPVKTPEPKSESKEPDLSGAVVLASGTRERRFDQEPIPQTGTSETQEDTAILKAAPVEFIEVASKMPTHQLPIRVIRARAKLAGVRFTNDESDEYLIRESKKLGEDPATEGPDMIGPGEEYADQNIFRITWPRLGGSFTVSAEGELWIRGDLHGYDADQFVAAITETLERADAHYQARYEERREQLARFEEYTLAQNHLMENPPPPDPDTVKIEEAWNALGFTGNFNFEAKLVQIAQANGVPLGEEIEDDDPSDEPVVGSRPGRFEHYTTDELKAKVLEALRKPVLT